ncbi:Microtubule-nucleating Tub4p (gamma-tubulin) complex component [Monosporozyma unispora]|nr:Microtubule-nucleating Tub4p (gamma-tubulin) complex component [Kazachstania unispora]
MDIQDKLYLVLEAIAPHGFPDSLIRSFTQQFLQLMVNPYRTPIDLEKLIFDFKKNTRLSPSSERLWSKLDGFVRPIFTMSDDNEIVNFINQFYTKLQEELQSPTRDATVLNLELNKQNLDRHDQLDTPSRSHIAPSVYAESFETVDKLSDRRSLYSLHYGPGTNKNINTIPMSKMADTFYINTLPEEDILKSVFYTLLGTTSDMFPIKTNVIQIPNSISNSTSGVLHLIFEAGLLYIKLSNQLEQNRNVHISPMKKALLTKITEYLYDYTRYVNSLSNMIEIRTLKGLYSKLYDPILQLRVYEKFIADFNYIRGDEYLTKFHSFKTHGNSLIQKITNDLYSSLITFYYDYMKKWLTVSKLESVFEEFFIEYNDKKLYIPYQLNEDKVPDFIPKETANQIFIIGKTYIYLTQFCNELQWANNFSQKYSKMYSSLPNDSNFTPFFKIIEEQYTELVEYTWNVLLEKQYFKETIDMLKDTLLMGKNDLIDSIIKNASSLLDEQSSSLTAYAYTRIVSDAIKQSSLSNYTNDHESNVLINRLDSRVLDLGQNLTGWDVFTLEYDIPEPLAITLNVNRSDGRKEYLRIFNFLWRFKRIEYICNSEMLKSKEMVHSFRNLRSHNSMVRDILNKLSKMSVLRSQLQQFNSKIESYYFQFIIDNAFKQLEHDLQLDKKSRKNSEEEMITLPNGLLTFEEPLKPLVDIFNFNQLQNTSSQTHSHPSLNVEEINNIHNKFLNDILSHPLLSSKILAKYSGKAYPTSLIEILQIIKEFISFFSKLHDIAHELFIQISLQSAFEELMELLEQFNEVSLNMVHCYKNFKHQTHIFIRDLRSDDDDMINRLGKILR